MRKKLIISLIFLFLLSTVGMPISVHFCTMTDMAEMENCEVCSYVAEYPTPTCCSGESDFPVKLKSDNSNQCCETKIIESSVKDDYLTSLSNINIDIAKLFVAISSDFSLRSFENGNIYYHITDSSPPFINYDIYLLNSSFLI